jgi:hypothetical protein
MARDNITGATMWTLVVPRSLLLNALGKSERPQSCLNRIPQRTHNVTRRSQKNCSSSESSLGEVAEGTEVRLIPACSDWCTAVPGLSRVAFDLACFGHSLNQEPCARWHSLQW